MVSMGLEDTSEVTIDEMIFAARSVARATKSAFTVSYPTVPTKLSKPLTLFQIGDLPMGRMKSLLNKPLKPQFEW